jgi:peptidyl-prolyl cis-trans isomerase A (cyclophilin A)
MPESRLLAIVLIVATSSISCRCGREDDRDRDGDLSAAATKTKARISGTGEQLVAGGEEHQPSPPPLLPGEKRRPRGNAPHPEPTAPDPVTGEFTLEQATEGLVGTGPLKATIIVDLGRIECTLESEKAPRTVANFVGLARGKRPWWDPYTGAWVNRPFYNGLTVYEVIPGSHIAFGSPAGDGTGGPGFTIADEIEPTLNHNSASVLTMVSDGPNTGGSRVMLLDGPAPHLNGRSSVFGHCQPEDAVFRIARVPQGQNHRPLTDVIIRAVLIERESPRSDE